MRLLAIFAIVAFAACSFSFRSTAASPIDSLVGFYTFNWATDPDKVKCAIVDKTMLKLFSSHVYNCDFHPTEATAENKVTAVCKKSDNSKQYLVFASRKDCENERETQSANE